MNRQKVKILLTIIGVLIVASCNKKTASNDKTLGTSHPDTPTALPRLTDQILCDNPQAEMGMQPSKAYVLHVPTNILQSLANKTIGCAAASCVTTATPTNNTKMGASGFPDPDADGVQPSSGPAEPITNVRWSVMNWRTPLDIDLDRGGPATYWKPGQPLLLEIVLDNPDFRFLHAQNTAEADFSPYAVMQGDEGSGMFRCLSAPRQLPNSSWYVTLRVFNSQDKDATGKLYGGGSHYGGLNIGVLVPAGPSGAPNILPVFFDPQIHNNG